MAQNFGGRKLGGLLPAICHGFLRTAQILRHMAISLF